MKIEDWKRKGKQTNYVINIFVRKFFPFRFATCAVIIILDLISLSFEHHHTWNNSHTWSGARFRRWIVRIQSHAHL